MADSDARPVPRKNTAFRLYLAIRKSDGSLITSWTGQDSEVSLDGGSFADCTAEATEIGTSGCGYIDLTAAEMNADCVMYKLTVTNSGALTLVLTLFPEEAGDYRADMVLISGDATAADNLESAADGTGYNLGGGLVVAASVTAEITLPTMPVDWVTASGLAESAVAEIQSGLATSSEVSSLQTSVDDLPTNAELAVALASSDDATLAALSITTGYALTSMRAAVVILGTISNAGTSAEQYTYGGVTVTYAGLDAAGNRSGVTIT